MLVGASFPGAGGWQVGWREATMPAVSVDVKVLLGGAATPGAGGGCGGLAVGWWNWLARRRLPCGGWGSFVVGSLARTGGAR